MRLKEQEAWIELSAHSTLCFRRAVMMNNFDEELLLLLGFGSGLESLDQCH